MDTSSRAQTPLKRQKKAWTKAKREAAISRGQWQSGEFLIGSDCVPPGTLLVKLSETYWSWSRAGGGGHEKSIGGNKRA